MRGMAGFCVVNGERRACGGVTVAALLVELALVGRKVAVERNGVIVPKSRYEEVRLAAGDKVEIVTAVGGG